MKQELFSTASVRPGANAGQWMVRSLGLAMVMATGAFAQTPPAVTNWPSTVDPTKKVHFYVADTAFEAPNANWTQSLSFLTGGDQAVADVTVCGPEVSFAAKRSSANPGYINVADTAFAEWNNVPQVDILVQVYGDLSVLNPTDPTKPRTWQAREGTTGSKLETGNTITLAAYPTNAYNNQWNWILFSITNKVVGDGTGTNRYIGSIPADSASSGSELSGVNHGTIRFAAPSAQNYLNGVTIHAIAFGEAGAFGTTNAINVFAPPVTTQCDPAPDSNLVGIDFDAGITNHLQVVETDNPVVYQTGVGPAGDKRKAVVPNGQYLNFGILDHYLGQPCNPNVIIKVCTDFYDDPSFAGQSIQFGPEAYATDPLGCNPNSVYPASGLYTLQGNGQWVRKSWTISGVNLIGVNTAPLTGGPRFISLGAPVALSRFYMAVLRTSGPLAGQDPLADCYADPQVCQNVYGNYAELDLAKGITDGLDLGSSQSDQIYVTETVGPADDQRLSVRPDKAPGYYLNFMILTNALGPTAQGNVHLAISVTYYDDPALAGKGFRPQVWKKEFGGALNLAFMDTPQNIVLQGTGKWREAYWEIGAISLAGVNQTPQAAARFEMDSPIHISRVRYAVIRPCGVTADVNLLASKVSLSAVPDTNSMVRLSWPYHAPQAQLQSASNLGGIWTTVPGTPSVEGGETSVMSLTNSLDTQFFRLNLTAP